MAKRKRSSLSHLNVDQFLNSLGDADWGSQVKPKRRRREESSDDHEEVCSSDDHEEVCSPDDHEEVCSPDDHEEVCSSGDHEEVCSSDDRDMGQLEPRPLHITSRKEEEDDVDVSSDGSQDGIQSEGRSEVNARTIERWVASVKKSQSLHSLSQLCNTLHSSLLSVTEGQSSFSQGAAHFNRLLVYCLKHVDSCITHYVPVGKTSLSSHPNWRRVKPILKCFLSDLLLLLQTLRDPSMQDVILRQILSFVQHYVCFPKLNKQLHKLLVEIWSTGNGHAQVLAFVAMKRAVRTDLKQLLPETIKKLYLAYVSNSKFLSVQTLHSVEFMQSCLVELLSLDGDICYRHCFVYIRQLTLTLRTALTSNKKLAHQTIYNWQYVHCLDLWCRVLREASSDSCLHPLIYPLVHTILGVVQLQPTARYFPVRLHLIRRLLHLGSSTMTFIPVQPYLLEVMEKCGSIEPRHKITGKPPNLQVMIKASKGDLQSQAYHNTVLNEAFELLLLFLSINEHSIAFPELSFPVIDKLKKLSQSTSQSWFRLQLKQLCEKVDEVCKEARKERAYNDFSPSSLDRIKNWERKQKTQQSSLSQFIITWVKLNHGNCI